MTKPEAIGLSSERLARIPAFLKERYIDTGKLPCAQVQVWRRGKLAVDEVMGVADRERSRRLDPDRADGDREDSGDDESASGHSTILSLAGPGIDVTPAHLLALLE